LVKFNESGVRQWGTYYGRSNTQGESCAVDGSGNVYMAGFTTSGTAISYQGHQNTYGGGTGDVYLVKFDSNGLRLWATYYGGSGQESGSYCSVDVNDNVFLAGLTGSPTAIASGGHQNIYGGVMDAFLVKFNSGGVRLWGTYYGGSEDDRGLSCATDGVGNVYLAGLTVSNTAIADGGHQNLLGGGSNWGDAFLVKFNESGIRQWATYYGGSSDDWAHSCAVDTEGNVYLAGFTASTASIASAGHQNTFGGVIDGFLVKFNGSGTRLWGTYYGGAEDDRIISVAVKDGSIYLSGNTDSTTDIASGGFQNTYGGVIDAFLVKMNSDGLRLWATYYGGLGTDNGYECAIDENGDVYLVGSTQGSDSAIADNGHQNTPAGHFDGFLVKFKGDLSTAIFTTAESLVATAFHLYPNPTRNGWFSLTLSDPAFTGSTPVMIELFDALGKRVHTERATPSGGELNHVLQLGKDHGVGLYSVVVSFGEVRAQRSLVVE
jgi:hypothetical protein